MPSEVPPVAPADAGDPAASTATAPLRRSPLHAEHEALGAQFTDFGGWSMPVRYSSDLAEHAAVRQAAGLFDISHMGEIAVTGPDAAAFLDAAVTVKASALEEGRIRYALILAEDGGIIDDLLVYHDAPGEYLVVANAGNREAVVAELEERRAGFDVELADLTVGRAMIALQGPAAVAILSSIVSAEGAAALAELRYYRCLDLPWGAGELLVSRTGYTGEDGFEISVELDDAVDLWRALLAAGGSHGLVPAGLAARDTLRLEAGMPLYGHELGLEVTPQQAGLGRVLAAEKPAGFVGSVAAKEPLAPDARLLVGLVGDGRRAARAGYPVLGPLTPSTRAAADAEGAAPGAAAPTPERAVVGSVTSGVLSPTLGVPIAMAFVAPEHAAEGTALAVDVRGTALPMTVVPLPFYRRPA